MESSRQGWRMRFSYRGATLVVCSFNFFVALLLLRSLFAGDPTRRGQADPELGKYLSESEEMRLAMEPVDLIKRLREIEQEGETEAQSLLQNDPTRNAAADLSKRLNDLRTMNDANGQKAVEEWLQRKIERDRARQQQTEKNPSGSSKV